MIRKHFYCICAILTIAFGSCLSKKDLLTGYSTLNDDFSVLNGTYKNNTVNSKYPQRGQSLHLLLFKNFDSYSNKSEDHDGSIRLTAISDNKIKIERFVDGEIVKTKILKGKMQNNFFVPKRKWRLWGVPIIFGAYYESMVAIGLAQNGYLYVKKVFENTGGIIAIGANSNTTTAGGYFAKTDSDGQEIYNQTVNLIDTLLKKNPDNRIFYKTELHSVDSYVWYDEYNNIVLYRITPNGTERNIVRQPLYRTSFNSEKMLVSPLLDLPQPNQLYIGYVESIDGKIMKYGMAVSDEYIHESERVFQENDFIRKVNEDLFEIKQKYGTSYYQELH
ncbi:hypothetical protein [Dysgonomonas sp.]